MNFGKKYLEIGLYNTYECPFFYFIFFKPRVEMVLSMDKCTYQEVENLCASEGERVKSFFRQADHIQIKPLRYETSKTFINKLCLKKAGSNFKRGYMFVINRMRFLRVSRNYSHFRDFAKIGRGVLETKIHVKNLWNIHSFKDETFSFLSLISFFSYDKKTS